MSSLSISLQVLHLRLTSPWPLSFLWASLNGELVFIWFASQVPSWFEGIMYISRLVSRYCLFLAQEVKNKTKTPQTHKQHLSMSSPRALSNLGATTWHPRTHPRQWDWYDFSDQQFCPHAMPSVWFVVYIEVSKLFPLFWRTEKMLSCASAKWPLTALSLEAWCVMLSVIRQASSFHLTTDLAPESVLLSIYSV